MKVALVIAAWASLVGCAGAQSGEPMGPVVTTVPDEFVLRDVRKDAARHLGCQVPNVSVAMGGWAGASGNVVAFGCGYQINYYLRCVTNHQCSISATD